MSKLEKFSADVYKAFMLLDAQQSYDSFVALIAASARRDEQERIIERFEACLCFEKYDCQDKRCTTIMDFIAIVKGDNK